MACTCNKYTFILSDRKCDFSQPRKPDLHGGHGPVNFPKPKDSLLMGRSAAYNHISTSVSYSPGNDHITTSHSTTWSAQANNGQIAFIPPSHDNNFSASNVADLQSIGSCPYNDRAASINPSSLVMADIHIYIKQTFRPLERKRTKATMDDEMFNPSRHPS